MIGWIIDGPYSLKKEEETEEEEEKEEGGGRGGEGGPSDPVSEMICPMVKI